MLFHPTEQGIPEFCFRVKRTDVEAVCLSERCQLPVSPCDLQALQYMRKLCSHPALVLDPGNEAHQGALQDVAPGAALPLRGLQHAPKLAALRELLAQCGIGHPPEGVACTRTHV